MNISPYSAYLQIQVHIILNKIGTRVITMLKPEFLFLFKFSYTHINFFFFLDFHDDIWKIVLCIYGEQILFLDNYFSHIQFDGKLQDNVESMFLNVPTIKKLIKDFLN